MWIKTAVYENDIGRLEFKKTGSLYMSSIDMTGNAVGADTEELLGAAGSVTAGLKYQAKTIPASFQFADLEKGGAERDRIAAIFSPMLYGVLTVFTEDDVYRIDCRPAEKPVFVRSDKVDYIWSWKVDFYADFPYWRKGYAQRKFTPSSTQSTVMSKTVNGTPVYIEFDSGCGGYFGINGNNFVVSTEHTEKIIINTQELIATDENGNIKNNVIQNYASAPLVGAVMNYGKNTVFFSPSGSSDPPLVRWWELSEGVF